MNVSIMGQEGSFDNVGSTSENRNVLKEKGSFQDSFQDNKEMFDVWDRVLQLTSYLYFIMIVPVLRYGPNKEWFPYGETREAGEAVRRIYSDTRLDDGRGVLDNRRFNAAMLFACTCCCCGLDFVLCFDADASGRCRPEEFWLLWM
jgi:hypothetical protein